MDDSMNFIITNLKNQYIIPNCSDGWSAGEHDIMDGIVSKFKCIITIRDVSIKEQECEDQDVGTALANIAEIIDQALTMTDTPGGKKLVSTPDSTEPNFVEKNSPVKAFAGYPR
jgi:hypothetical protein